MATLIAAYNSDGCIGRCDAKCYNAEGPDCDCICGGKNHGAGKEQAIKNTEELAQEWMETYQALHPEKLEFKVAPSQRDFFALVEVRS